MEQPSYQPGEEEGARNHGNSDHGLTTIREAGIAERDYGQPTLLGLPAEVRNIIYEHLFEGLTIHGDRRRPEAFIPTNPAPCYSILETGRLIYKESKTVFYGSVTFTLGMKTTPEELNSLFGANALLVRDIHYDTEYLYDHLGASVIECLSTMFLGLKRLELMHDWWPAFLFNELDNYPDNMDFVLRTKPDEWRAVRFYDALRASSFCRRQSKCRTTLYLPFAAFHHIDTNEDGRDEMWHYDDCLAEGMAFIDLKDGVLSIKDHSVTGLNLAEMIEIGFDNDGNVYAWPQKDWFTEDEKTGEARSVEERAAGDRAVEG